MVRSHRRDIDALRGAAAVLLSELSLRGAARRRAATRGALLEVTERSEVRDTTTAGKASGTTATARAMPNMNISMRLAPRMSPSATMSDTTASAETAFGRLIDRVMSAQCHR